MPSAISTQSTETFGGKAPLSELLTTPVGNVLVVAFVAAVAIGAATLFRSKTKRSAHQNKTRQKS
jgi:hypothetical protein